MYSLRASDGAIRWQTSDLGAGLGRTGRFYSTPAVAFGRVYAGNVDGRVYSFDRQTGEIAWTFSAGDYVYSGIAAADGPRTKPAVYFGSHDRFAYSLDAKNGKLNWKEKPGGQVSGPATVVGDVVYVSTFSGDSTVGFDLGTGRRIFKFDEGEYGPVVSDGKRLYLLGGSEVVAFRPISVGDYEYEPKPGEKGIVPPAERRKAHAKAGNGSKQGQDKQQNQQQKKKKKKKKTGDTRTAHTRGACRRGLPDRARCAARGSGSPPPAPPTRRTLPIGAARPAHP